MTAEKKLISLMSGSKKCIGEVMKSFQPEDFSNEIHQKVVRLIYDAKNEGKTIEPSLILNEFASDEIRYVSDIFYNMEEYEDSDKALNELIKNIKIEKLAALLSQAKDPQTARELAFQIDKLRRNVENG